MDIHTSTYYILGGKFNNEFQSPLVTVVFVRLRVIPGCVLRVAKGQPTWPAGYASTRPFRLKLRWDTIKKLDYLALVRRCSTFFKLLTYRVFQKFVFIIKSNKSQVHASYYAKHLQRILGEGSFWFDNLFEAPVSWWKCNFPMTVGLSVGWSFFHYFLKATHPSIGALVV